MKKLFVTLSLLLAATLLIPIAAQAATEKETQICAEIKEKDNIADAQCVIYDNNCLIALKTEKFASKSDYDTFKEQLRSEIAKTYGFNKVLITRSPKAMHAISQFAKLSDSERDDAVKEFFEQEFNHIKRPPLQPKMPA